MQTVLKIIACTPNSNFDDDEYNNGVIIPARELRNIRENLDNIDFNPKLIEDIIIKLVNILKVKFLDNTEIVERIAELTKLSSIHVEDEDIQQLIHKQLSTK